MYYRPQLEPGPCSLASRALDQIHAFVAVGLVTLVYGAFLSAMLAGFLVILDLVLP